MGPCSCSLVLKIAFFVNPCLSCADTKMVKNIKLNFIRKLQWGFRTGQKM